MFIWLISRKCNQHKNYHLTSIRKDKWQKCCQGCGGKGIFGPCWWACKLVQLLWETGWRVLKKLNIGLPYNSAAPLLGIYLREMETRGWKDNLFPLFAAALFTISKNWNNLNVHQQWTDRENVISMHIYPCKIEYYSGRKKPKSDIYINIEDPWGHYAEDTEWNKSDKEKHILLWSHLHVEPKKSNSQKQEVEW